MTQSRRLSPVVLIGLIVAGCSDFATEPDRRPAALRITPDTILVTAGEAVAFGVTVLDQNGDPYEQIPSWSPPLWSSSDAGLLQVSEDGIGHTGAPGKSMTLVDLAGLHGEATVRANPAELGVDVPVAYITQSTQRHDWGVPLVAGRDGLLRVFVTGSGINFFRPAVRAVFVLSGVETHTAVLELENEGLPLALDESDLALSYDMVIPGEVLVPGVAMSVEVDPGGVVPSTPGSILRVPEQGDMPLDVRAVPPFQLRLVPIHHDRDSDLADSAAQGLTRLTREIYPFFEFDVDVREPYVTGADLSTDQGWFDLIYEIAVLRDDDGSDRYYYGGFRRSPGTNILGLGFVGYPVSIGTEENDGTVAHEIGHNLGLGHAPCGGAGNADKDYPYQEAGIGQYGYDPRTGRIHRPDRRFDLMSYCDPIWISDYNYEKVLEYRDTSAFDAAFEDRATGAIRAPRERTLVVGGSIRDGELRLQPALELDVMLPRQSPTGGTHVVEGLDAAGDRLFSVPVTPWPLGRENSAVILAAIDVEVAQPDRLVTLRLRGPEGVVERTRGAGTEEASVRVERLAAGGAGGGAVAEARWNPDVFPLAVVRNRSSGRIIAISRVGVVRLPNVDPAQVEVLLSDGVATESARVRVR